MYQRNGFTLLELLITLMVITVLGVISVMSYSSYILRANRADAKAALVRLAQQEERYYSVNRRYLNESNDKQALKKLGFPTKTSEKGYYKLAIAKHPDVGDKGYLLKAVPVATKRQARDTECPGFTLDHTGEEGVVGVKKGDNGAKEKVAQCWNR